METGILDVFSNWLKGASVADLGMDITKLDQARKDLEKNPITIDQLLTAKKSFYCGLTEKGIFKAGTLPNWLTVSLTNQKDQLSVGMDTFPELLKLMQEQVVTQSIFSKS
jgi:hypothetical protein